MRRTTALLAVTVLVLSACGGDDKAAAPTTTGAPTTAAPTTPPPSGGAPLTGLPADPARLARPALVVKVDNAPNGRPQAGINAADVVVEQGVEGGVTRLAVVFHSNDIDSVGPVRSARSTDIAIVSALNRPLFAYAGANRGFLELVRAAPLVDVGFDARAGAYSRQRGRPAPYNLFADFGRLYADAAGTPPPPMFSYRGEGEAGAGEPAPGVSMEWRGRVVTSVSWAWDAASGTWRRTQNGTAHVDAAGAPVAPKNVVVQFVPYHDSGYIDTSGEPVPEAELVGEGDAWVFSDGKIVRGRWKKPSPEAPTAYVDASGAPIRLTPGTTWLELPKPGMASVAS